MTYQTTLGCRAVFGVFVRLPLPLGVLGKNVKKRGISLSKSTVRDNVPENFQRFLVLPNGTGVRGVRNRVENAFVKNLVSKFGTHFFDLETFWQSCHGEHGASRI